MFPAQSAHLLSRCLSIPWSCQRAGCVRLWKEGWGWWAVFCGVLFVESCTYVCVCVSVLMLYQLISSPLLSLITKLCVAGETQLRSQLVNFFYCLSTSDTVIMMSTLKSWASSPPFCLRNYMLPACNQQFNADLRTITVRRGPVAIEKVFKGRHKSLRSIVISIYN